MNRSAYWLLVALIGVILVLEIVRGDGWRSFGVSWVLVGVLWVRHELTEQT